MPCLPTTAQVFSLIFRRAIRVIFTMNLLFNTLIRNTWNMRYDYPSPNNIKKLWPNCFHSGIWNTSKENYYFTICQIWVIHPGKNGRKNDCLTTFYITQQIHPNLGNTLKNWAPSTAIPETTTRLSWRDLPNIWSLCFCLPSRMRNEQIKFSQAWIYVAIFKNNLLAAS